MTTVTLEAAMTPIGSKRGERYIELDIDAPYMHTAMLTVTATDNQDDNALNEALEPAFRAGRARIVAKVDAFGTLVCGSDDITAA